MLLTDDLIARARRVRLFLCDVDGVLTETNVIMGGGIESKTFHIRDGLGLRLLQSEAAIRVGWISARQSHATSMRAADLQVDFLRQSATPKVEVIEALLSEIGLQWEEVHYMGDDVVDLGVLKRAGFATVPADAISEAQALAHFVSQHPGGRGAVREVTDLILKAQGHWDRIVAKFTS